MKNKTIAINQLIALALIFITAYIDEGILMAIGLVYFWVFSIWGIVNQISMTDFFRALGVVVIDNE